MNYLYGLLASALVIISISSCKKEVIEQADAGTKQKNIVIVDSVRFKADIMPMLEDKCFCCHGPECSYKPDLSTPNTFQNMNIPLYINKSNPESSYFYTYLIAEDNSHGMSFPQEAELILKWIKQGAKNN